jgi:hypothetical protein
VLPAAATLVMSKSTNDHHRAVIRPLIMRDTDGTVLWCDPERTDEYPGMPRPTAVRLHDDVVAVLAGRLADAYDAQGGCAGPLTPHDESGWDDIDLNLLIFDIDEALDARGRATLPAVVGSGPDHGQLTDRRPGRIEVSACWSSHQIRLPAPATHPLERSPTMPYNNGGVRINGTSIPTKTALKRATTDDPADVEFYSTSEFGNQFHGRLTEIPADTTLSVAGPDPYTRPTWYASITRTGQKVTVR